MVDVLLVKLDNAITEYPPLGLLYLADALEKNDYSVKIIHEVGTNKSIARIVRTVKKEKPLFVGFSTMTGPQLLPTLQASETIRRETGVPILWGGVHPTILPEQTLKETCVDFIIIGEGEEAIVELADSLSSGQGTAQIKGLGYKSPKIRVNPPRPFIKNLDAYAPAWHLVDVKKYYRRYFGCKKVITLITSRGCPFRCSFCYNLAVNKRTWRCHSERFVLDHIHTLVEEYGIDGIDFHDDNFFANPKRALSLAAKLELPWSGEIRADILTRDLARKLKERNCHLLFVGAESGSQRVLDLLKKDIKVEDLYNAVEHCKEADLPIDLSFMFGIPGEREEDVLKTVQLMKRVSETYGKVNMALKMYTPYPGTTLWDVALKNGLRPPEKTKDWVGYTRDECNNPWLSDPAYALSLARIVNTAFANEYFQPVHPGLKLFRAIDRFRVRHSYFKYPFELKLLSVGSSALRLKRSILK